MVEPFQQEVVDRGEEQHRALLVDRGELDQLRHVRRLSDPAEIAKMSRELRPPVAGNTWNCSVAGNTTAMV